MNRMIALDMLRGFALISIMINHMPVSVLRSVTLPNYSIFDAAELFVLLSGFLVGMVWTSVQRNNGVRAAQMRFARRAVEVWLALIIGAVLMALLSAWLWSHGLRHTAIWNQYAIWVIENPLGYVGVLATLWLQPNLVDVLSVYVVLLATVPLLAPVLQRLPFAFAAGSLVMWWFAPLLNGFIPNHRTGGLLFNPFAWQMLFYSGVAMAMFRPQLMEALRPHSRLITVLATGMFLFGSTIVIAAKFGEPALPLREALKVLYGGAIDKWNLDGTRYLAIMSASWLVAVPLADIMRRLAATSLGVALQKIGRGGLWSFLVCVMLSVLGDAFQMNPEGQAIWRRLLVDLWALLALWWLSVMWLNYGAPWQKARRDARSATAKTDRDA